MSTLAAVMTGKGTGAIAAIAIYGSGSEVILSQIFEPRNAHEKSFEQGKLVLGKISSENGLIDEVLIGCESSHCFTINCHGNPLILADIMKLLQKHGVEPVTAERMIFETSTINGEANAIATEAKIAVADSKTLWATRTILYQVDKGLSLTANKWLANPDLETIQTQAKDILERGAAAKPLLFGAKIVLAGPPNSGKSTLFNYLAGKQKAIVTGHKGTTRDWVSAECIIGAIWAEVIDTAGIDEKLFSNSEEIEKISQQKAKELLASADLILLVLDASVQMQQNLGFTDEIPADRKTLTILNKTDLTVRFEPSQLPKMLRDAVEISAKLGTGCDSLILRIEQFFDTAQFDCQKALCFTARQEQLLQQITEAKNKGAAVSVITELLKGKVRV